MLNILQILQITLATTLIILIILQAKGVGLGRAWSGAGDFYKSRRGVEKIIFQFTIIIAALFFVSSILNIIFYK